LAKVLISMKQIQPQATLAELRQRATPQPDGVEPLEQISGTVDGGPVLVVKNHSAAPQSSGLVVSVGGDASSRNTALTAQADQENGIGVIGTGDYGVVGFSDDHVGVMGAGTTGVFGFSLDPHGIGVEGRAISPSGIGVLANAPDADTTALAISDGSIRVIGAGENTPTPVFVHVANEKNTRGAQTVLDHPMSNGDPHAILLVTRRDRLFFTQSGSLTPLPPQAEPFSVAYSSRANKWLILQNEDTIIPTGATFNVLVVKV
jgi:hypothetical protein